MKVLKRIIHIKDDIYYSPAHNTFFRVEGIVPDDVLAEIKGNQNIIMEIKGNEEKVFEFLLTKPFQQVTKKTIEDEFVEIISPYDKVIDSLNSKKLKGILQLHDILVKRQGTVTLYVQGNPLLEIHTTEKAKTPSLLFYRATHYADYDVILSEFSKIQEDDASKTILNDWLCKCRTLESYDEKCIMLLERLCFLPAFGNVEAKNHFIDETREIVYRFEQSDVSKYEGSEMLCLVHNLIYCVTDYLKLQIDKYILNTSADDYQRRIKTILRQFQTVSIPDDRTINPLLALVYHDYLGLTYYRCYKYTHDNSQLSLAAEELEIASDYAKQVDMHLQIWTAFISFNLARVYEELGKKELALKNYDITVSLRQCLAESPFFSNEIKHDLYFEYLLAKIKYIDSGLKYGQFLDSEAQKEYELVSNELKTHYYIDDRGGNQDVISRMLAERVH